MCLSSNLERCIEASTEPGDLVADFFCGSGTTLAVAEKRGRRWIGCDLGRFAIHTTRKRLMEIDSSRTFEVLNLGKYERQYWQGVTFGEKSTHVTEQALYEYLAFMLKLYGALEPVVGVVELLERLYQLGAVPLGGLGVTQRLGVAVQRPLHRGDHVPPQCPASHHR